MKEKNIAYKKRWTELSWEELIRYHSIRREATGEPSDASSVSDLMEKMQEWEIVSGMTILGVGGMPLDEGEKDRLEDVVKWLEIELAMGGRCVWMKESGEGRGAGSEEQEIYLMKRDEFVREVRRATAWMEKKEGLLKLPEKWMVIGGETFALPTFVGTDERVVRYGQYGDMQMYMMGIMSVMGRLEEQGAGGDDQERELLEQMRMYRNGFLSTLLLPTVTEQVKVDDVDAKEGYRWETRRMVMKYDSGVRERIAEKLDKAPAWLFSLLWHLTQSSLAYYHGRFPDLVSTKSQQTKRNTDVYVAKLGTDNAVMKYAGYPNVKAVNDEPVGVILERLDAMAKESKEWEKARRKK